jgi:hypothetical protein
MQQAERDEEMFARSMSIPGRVIRPKFIDLRDAQ